MSPSSRGDGDSSPASTMSSFFSGLATDQTTDDNAPVTYLERKLADWNVDSIRAVSGATAGFASGVVTCPLDVIKTKLQAQGGFRIIGRDKETGRALEYKGVVGTARVIWHEEGIRGMYRGLTPTVVGYLPTWAVYFLVYEKSKRMYGRRFSEERQWLAHIFSAMTAGACSTMVTNPIWVIKTRLMSQASTSHHHYHSPWQYKSTWDAFKTMYRNEGLMSFYSGLAPALLGLTHVAVQFPLYEYFKRHFTGEELGQRTEGGQTPYLSIVTASCLSKVFASTATYPHEVIRTRLQTQQRSLPKDRGGTLRAVMLDPSRPSIPVLPGVSSSRPPRYKGIVQTVRTILKEEGWRAFYAGMGTSMLRAVPASTTTLLTYETVVEYLLRKQERGIAKITAQGL